MPETPRPSQSRILAIDTSTERLGVALGHAGEPTEWFHQGPGGARASLELIAVVQGLLAQSGWRLAELDAIAVGIGPGAFTGLRTACAVVQGLGLAARPGGVPVLPVPTLLAVAEDARFQWAAQHPEAPAPTRIIATLDARMDEAYALETRLTAAGDGPALPVATGHPWVAAPERALDGLAPPDAHTLLAGNALAVYGPRWPAAWAHCAQYAQAWPSPLAMLRLAPALLRAGCAGPAETAQPLYVRDKVAQTTAEREHQRAARPVA